VTVFGAYSRYYDLLYRDKDYAAEAGYVRDLLVNAAPTAHSLLELGCGTGAHAAELAALGYSVTGVDLSEGMLEAARTRKTTLPEPLAGRLSFEPGDARTVRLERKFDAVISLFHVMSYQTTNEDLGAAFATVREHLVPGGVFVFDCWYGPAVLAQRPAVAVKRLSDDCTEVTRIAEPVMRHLENVVDVHYSVMVVDMASGLTETLRETHRMRYLFAPEIELALNSSGMTLVASRAWMLDTHPGLESWAACFVGRG